MVRDSQHILWIGKNLGQIDGDKDSLPFRIYHWSADIVSGDWVSSRV
jgi:hypothetical protein